LFGYGSAKPKHCYSFCFLTDIFCVLLMMFFKTKRHIMFLE
jgi:hypothetical protein